MSTKNKRNNGLPEVHVIGDLNDVKKLIKRINKKNTLVIFRNGENGATFTHVDHEIIQFADEDLNRLSRDYRLVYFEFFPGRKKDRKGSEPVDQHAENIEEQDNPGKKRKKEKEKQKKGGRGKNKNSSRPFEG